MADSSSDAGLVLAAYRALRAAKGEEPAIAWVVPRLPRADPHLAVEIFDQDATGLLWRVSDSLPSVWLLRAAAERLHPGSHLADVIAHFQADSDPAGRVIAGIDPESSLAGVPRTLKDTCRIAWVLAVRAQAEGRREDASGWYRVALETGQTQEREFRWSLRQLKRWAEAGPERSPEQLAGKSGP
jgi:hypothetical protein